MKYMKPIFVGGLAGLCVAVLAIAAADYTARQPLFEMTSRVQAQVVEVPNMTIVAKGFNTTQVLARVDDLDPPPFTTRVDRLPASQVAHTTAFQLADLKAPTE